MKEVFNMIGIECNQNEESHFQRFSSRSTWAGGNYHHKVDFTSSRGRKGMLHFAAPRTNIRLPVTA